MSFFDLLLLVWPVRERWRESERKVYVSLRGSRHSERIPLELASKHLISWWEPGRRKRVGTDGSNSNVVMMLLQLFFLHFGLLVEIWTLTSYESWCTHWHNTLNQQIWPSLNLAGSSWHVCELSLHNLKRNTKTWAWAHNSLYSSLDIPDSSYKTQLTPLHFIETRDEIVWNSVKPLSCDIWSSFLLFDLNSYLYWELFTL